MTDPVKARTIGLNHIRSRSRRYRRSARLLRAPIRFSSCVAKTTMAFIDLGDQFIALQRGRKQPADDGRHFGLVVDNKETARLALKSSRASRRSSMPVATSRPPLGPLNSSNPAANLENRRKAPPLLAEPGCFITADRHVTRTKEASCSSRTRRGRVTDQTNPSRCSD